MQFVTRRLVYVAAAALASAVHADDEPHINFNGVIAVGMESASNGDLARSRVVDNGSKLIIKGEHELDHGLNLNWQFGNKVNLDEAAGKLASDNTWVEIANRWGSLRLGREDTPYTTALDDFDPFNDTTGSFKALLGSYHAASSEFSGRLNNSIAVHTANINGVEANFASGSSENRNSNERPRLLSASVAYKKDGWLGTLAWEHHHHTTGLEDNAGQPGNKDWATRAGLGYGFGPLFVGVVAERYRLHSEGNEPQQRDAWFASASYENGNGKLLATAGKAGNLSNSGNGADGARQYSLGFDYAFSRRTDVLAYYTRISNDGNGRYDFANNKLDVDAGKSSSASGVTLRHLF